MRPNMQTPAGGPALTGDKERKPKQSTAPTAAPQPDKAFTTLAAEATLIGATLVRLDDGTPLLSRWTWGQQLPDIDAVRALLSRMRGVR